MEFKKKLRLEESIYKIKQVEDLIGYMMQDCFDGYKRCENLSIALYDLEYRQRQARLMLDIIFDILHSNYIILHQEILEDQKGKVK